MVVTHWCEKQHSFRQALGNLVPDQMHDFTCMKLDGQLDANKCSRIGTLSIF